MDREKLLGESRLIMKNYTVNNCNLIQFPKISDSRGILSFIESPTHISFKIKRVYYLYELTGENRGFHAHKHLEQIYVALSGSFKVKLDDGTDKKEIILNDPSKGLYISPWIWREISEISENAILFVLASEIYKESDYIRNYKQFIKDKK